MKVRIEEEYFGTSIYLIDNNKLVCVSFGGNLDLYWTFMKKERKYMFPDEVTREEFVITKENYRLFELFDGLYDDIENINIFDEKTIPGYVSCDEELMIRLKERQEYIKQTRTACRLRNACNYNTLFNPEEKKITWYSDETNAKVSNVLEIYKEDDRYKLVFRTQPYINGYDEEVHAFGLIPIRFRNSGSHYDPFNIVFMEMYRKLQEIDDIKDIGHQIHIEEYLYNKELVKKKAR